MPYRSLFIWLAILTGCSSPPSPPTEKQIVSKYRPGQTWSYKTRKGEESSRIIICKVEPHEKLGNIVHVHVTGVAIKSPASRDGIARTIHHSPYAEAAIDKSVTALIAENGDLPDFNEGYREWKQSFDKGKAGIFTISVAEGVDVMEQALNKGASTK
jgi:hypothetical protein